MKKSSFIDFLNFVYNSTYVPINYFEAGELTASFPQWSFIPQYLFAYRDSIEAQGLTLHYFSTEDFLLFGIVRNPETNQDVMLGPVSTMPVTDEMFIKIIEEYNFDDESPEDLKEFFERTPLFSSNQFLNIIGLINKELNEEIIDIYEYFNLNKDISREVAATHSNSLMERKENENYHNTYYFEQEYFGYLERGDVDGIMTFFKTVPAFTEGNVASDSIRQAKNIFITTVSLATRHAIAGGLDIETAYQLSDTYIQQAEKMSDPSQITILSGTALLDFARRVSESKIPTGMSKDIFRAIQYISNHVNRPISVAEVADELGIDRTTLSKKFSRELGFNISSFIMRRKLEEAKSLLTHTDKTISEISEYLCFSSQAYFQNVFKKKYGVTPREYRLQK